MERKLTLSGVSVGRLYGELIAHFYDPASNRTLEFTSRPGDDNYRVFHDAISKVAIGSTVVIDIPDTAIQKLQM
ncbi:MAG: hypothetical protein NTU57_03305 [Candidatus Aenigmarchaeota archaeon]|nr:hypothetical protein [Candidatus Aenigmarchaeota archaeon]